MHILVPVLLLLPVIPAGSAEAADTAAWNVSCAISHYKTDDPIVFPGQAGASHMHAFFASTTTSSASTTASLLASPSTCARGFENTDHSAYWVPALYRKTTSGGIEQVTGATGQEQTMTTYYRRGGQANGPQVQPFPQGLRMIAGDGMAIAAQATSIAHWRCRDLKVGSSIGPPSAAVPTCNAGQFIEGVIIFPSCWNGTSLDSSDHKSHMAYPTSRGSTCPADHPVVLPRVTMEVKFRSANGDGSQYSLASGGQFSLHGDFFAAWDNQVQSALVNSCLNSPHKCTGINRRDVDMAAATPGSGTGGKVLADTSSVAPVSMAPDMNHPAAAAPVQATTVAATLPETGPSAALASLAVAAMLLGFFYYRRSKRQLLETMRRSR